MLVSLYSNVYTSIKDLVHVAVPLKEWSILGAFNRASSRQLVELDDVCAVCLCVMSQARRTPCGHYFHGRCLLRCLQERSSCPICTTHFNL